MTRGFPVLPRCRGFGHWGWLALLAGGAAAAVLAYLFFRTGNPTAPTKLSPQGTLLRGHIPTTTVPLIWTQGGITTSLFAPPPGRAYRFVICVYATNATHDCAAGTGNILFESREAQQIPRRDAGFRSLRMLAESVLNPRYEYTYDAVLPSNALDVPLQWTVGACSRSDNTSCSFADPQSLALTARNLAIVRIEYDRVSGDVPIHVELRNDGETSGEPYEVRTIIWKILPDALGTNALLDVNDSAVQATDLVVTRDGLEHPVGDYRNGTRPTDEILAIRRADAPRIEWMREVSEVPVPGELRPERIDPCNNASPCLFNTQGRPALLAGFSWIDPNNLLVEFNEQDNTTRRSNIRLN